MTDNPTTEKIDAKWIDDCQGKKDYDAEIVYLSSRYWPQGGGFTVIGGGFRPSIETNPDIRPSATATIAIRIAGDGASELASRDFEGDSFEEVAAEVEAWAAEQFCRVVDAVRKEFSTCAVNLKAGSDA
jgi:hypothetical protein